MKRLAAFALTLLATAGVSAQDAPPRTGIFVLIDVSATWLTKEAQKDNELILREVNRAVMDLTTKVETPIAIYYLPIEADSVLKRPLCEFTYRKSLINLRKKEGEINDRQQLADQVELCGNAMLARPVAKWTDIHGALASVSQVNAGQSFFQRFMFVASDFKEERPQGALPTLALPSFRVATIYRVLAEDSRNPKGLEDRLANWHAILRKAGAAGSVDAVDKTRFASSVTQTLLTKELQWK